MEQEVRECTKFEKGAVGGWRVDYFVLQNPGKVVWNEYGVEPSRERRINVGTGAVADHPGRIGSETVLVGECAVGGFVLLRHDFHLGKVGAKTGSIKLVILLREVALGDHVEFVALGQLFQRAGDARKQFNLLFGD